MRRFQNSVASIAVLAMILPAQFQAVVAGTCCCACCASPDTVSGDATNERDANASAGSDRLQIGNSSDGTLAGLCPCCAGRARPADNIGCGACTCHTRWHAVAALRARLTNLKKTGKKWAPVLRADCLGRASTPMAQRLATPNCSPVDVRATELCTVLCRFLL